MLYPLLVTTHDNECITFRVSRDVNDIHSVLEVTVFDQDKDHAVDFLGKLAIPMLQVRATSERSVGDRTSYGDDA